MSLATPTPVRAPRGDLLVSTVTDKALILDRAGERAHLLNASALWVFDLLDGTRSVDDIVAVIASELAVEDDTIRADVVAAVDEFTDAGLLDGDDPAPSPTAPAAVRADDEAPTAGAPPAEGTLGPYDAIGFTFVVHTADGVIADELEPLLAGLATDRPPVAGYTLVDHRADHADATAGRYEARLGRTPISRSDRLGTVIDTLLAEINRRAIADATGRLVFHAGAVDLGGGLVLPANSGSGKSTLTAALVGHGARYLSDEAAVIDPLTSAVEPYAKPLALSASSLTALGHLVPAAPEAQPGAAKQHVAVARFGATATVPVPLRAIIFPRYDADAVTALTPLAPDEALIALVPCTFAATWEVDDALERAIAMVESVPAYQLEVADLADAVELVTRLSTTLDEPR